MIASRSALPIPFRSAGPRAAEAPAPEGVSSSLPASGAGHSFVLAADGLRTGRADGRDVRLGLRPMAELTFEGDLVAVPAFERAACSRFSARARVAGREGDASGAFPLRGDDLAATGLRSGRAERRDAPSGLRPAAAGPP